LIYPLPFSAKEYDLGVLVLRIGGPRLVTAFSKSNMLPCTSSIKSFLSGNYPITYNYNKTIEEIVRILTDVAIVG